MSQFLLISSSGKHCSTTGFGSTHWYPIFGQTHISRITNIKAQVKQFLLAHHSVPLEPTTVGVTLSRIGTKALEYLYPWQPYTPCATRLNFVVLGLKSELQGCVIAHYVSQVPVFKPFLECFQVLLGCYKILQNCEVIPSQLTVAAH